MVYDPEDTVWRVFWFRRHFFWKRRILTLDAQFLCEAAESGGREESGR